jgi:exosortase
MAGIVSAGFVLFALAGLLAASVAWTHALVLFVLAASLCCFLLGGLLILADERVRVLPFNWISLTALFLWLLVAPLPNGTYARLTLSLQNGVTGAVFHALHLFGIPARQHGNMIELATTTVGVEEACSGIRSLLSCVCAGFFFAAWQLRRTGSRIVLIGVAPLLALGMNFLRSLLLTLMANSGKDITGFWHDATGYAILGITAAILAWLAIVLETDKDVAASAGRTANGSRSDPAAVFERTTTRSPSRHEISRQAGSLRWSRRFFWAGVVASLALGVFYFSHSRPASTDGKPIPDLSAMLPLQAGGWQVTSAKDLYQFADVLQTNHLVERTYLRPIGRDQFVRLTVYIAYWPAGQATVSRVASHTPDACWPGSGWMAKPSDESRQVLSVPHFQLYPAEHRLFQNGDGIAQHVWFWHIYDGRPINYRDPYSVPALLELAWQYGFRRQGDQFFIRLSSNQPWSEIASEPLVGELVSNFATLGL